MDLMNRMFKQHWNLFIILFFHDILIYSQIEEENELIRGFFCEFSKIDNYLLSLTNVNSFYIPSLCLVMWYPVKGS